MKDKKSLTKQVLDFIHTNIELEIVDLYPGHKEDLMNLKLCLICKNCNHSYLDHEDYNVCISQGCECEEFRILKGEV